MSYSNSADPLTLGLLVQNCMHVKKRRDKLTERTFCLLSEPTDEPERNFPGAASG